MINNVEYRIYTNGTVTDIYGNVIFARGGSQQLTACVSPCYETIRIEGTDYLLFSNGTVTNIFGEFITSTGIEGLHEYLITVHRGYEIVVISGVTYHVFTNGSVTDANGIIIISSGGIQALRVWIER